MEEGSTWLLARPCARGRLRASARTYCGRRAGNPETRLASCPPRGSATARDEGPALLLLHGKKSQLTTEVVVEHIEFHTSPMYRPPGASQPAEQPQRGSKAA